MDFCYKTIYRVSNFTAYLRFHETLFSLFMEYASSAPTTSITYVKKHDGKAIMKPKTNFLTRKL